MSPLNSILVSGQRRASAPLHFGTAACAAFLLALAFLAPAGAQTMSDGEVRKAEKVLAKLRLLHDAAGADDADAYRKLVSKFYPDLFVKVAELREGDLSTDLATAVFLAEQLGRAWSAAGIATVDCRDERPDIYQPLCLGLHDGTARQLLLAKSRLHTRWAEALTRSFKGESDAETERLLVEVREARANDRLIAAHIVKQLRRLETLPPPAQAGAAGAGLTETLRDAGTLLTWMPRSATFYQLLSARQAFEDGLWWHNKGRQAKSLVVSAQSFAPDPLKELRLNAEQVSATARANWGAASKHTLLAEKSLSQSAR